jgi:hypothetical protein
MDVKPIMLPRPARHQRRRPGEAEGALEVQVHDPVELGVV